MDYDDSSTTVASMYAQGYCNGTTASQSGFAEIQTSSERDRVGCSVMFPGHFEGHHRNASLFVGAGPCKKPNVQSSVKDLDMLASKTLPIHSDISFGIQQESCSSRTRNNGSYVSGKGFEKLRALLKAQDPYVKPKARTDMNVIGAIPNVNQDHNSFHISAFKKSEKAEYVSHTNLQSAITRDTQLQANHKPANFQNNFDKMVKPIQNPLPSTLNKQELSNTRRSFKYRQVSQSYSTVEGTCDAIELQEQNDIKKQRFLRTKEALAKSGLLDVTMKTASLMGKNEMLQSEIEELKQQATQLIKSITSNRENSHTCQSVQKHI